ncbi:MAG TPA: peptide ABC transporter substrate-binding protein [Candidatus Baltobacteraceae bacterium]
MLACANACSQTVNGTQARDRLVVGRIADVQSLNPLLLQGADTAAIGPLVFSYLLGAGPGGSLAPDVAVAVPSLRNGGVSPDGKTIVYRLRKNVLWQDGKPLTSADVAFTYRQVMNPRNDVPTRDVWDRIASIDTPDPQTVRIRLRAPNSAVLSYFFGPDGNYPILPEHLLRGYSDLNHAAFNAMPVGSGPFRVVQWTRADHITLQRFDRYFGGTPELREIVLKILASQTTELVEMRTHEIDATVEGSITQLQDFAGIPGVRAVRAPVYGGALIAFNVRDPMVADVRVRRAIAEAADLPRLVAQASHGTLNTVDAGRGLYGPDYDSGIQGAPAYDLADANRLLDAAGWPRDGSGTRQRNGVSLAPTFVYIQSRPEVQAFALLLQAQLQRAGIALTLRPYTEQEYGAPASAGGPLFSGRFQMALLNLLIALDPSTGYLFGCDDGTPTGFNVTRYCNPEVDRANAASLRTYDPKERAAQSAVVQREVARDLPLVPVWQQANAVAYPGNLSGVDPAAYFIFGNVAKWRYLPPP